MENELKTIRIPYYPGCTLKSNAKHFEISALAAAKKIGIEMVELPRWNCCGAVYSLTSDDLMKQLAPVRNFVRVQEMNKEGLVDNEYRLLTLCSMCFNTLKQTNKRVKENPEDMESINNFMYLEEDYKGNVEVIHFFELLKELGFDRLKNRITKSLEGMKLAAYYGCTLLRPKSVGIDAPENPTIMENFIRSLGAEAVDWTAKSRCCGSYHTVSNKPIVVNQTEAIIENARKYGAEAIITSCPLCAFNLDNRQKEVMEKNPDFESMPIFYFSQLMALALGVEEEELGLDGNYINPVPFLKKKNLL